MDLIDQRSTPAVLERSPSASAGSPAAATAPTGTRPATTPTATRRRVEAIAGRLIDITVASVVLVLLAPALAVIALLVTLSSPGPVLFRQERLGRDRAPFRLFKFRTMRSDTSEDVHREYVQTLIATDPDEQHDGLYKLTVDHRITAIGRVLRSWSLDEIPQLINVLRGEMALVGPRPVIAYEAELYPESYMGRFAVTPGLTGLWQVSGRNERTYDEMVQYDLQYAERRSLWLDLEILLRTIPVVLRRRGVA